MEQISKTILNIFCLLSLFSFLLGCRSEDPNPELKDPIYQSLKKEADDSVKALADAKVAKEMAYELMNNTPAQTIELKEAEREYWKSVRMVDSLETASKYLKIRAERRKVETRLSYKKAFANRTEKDWPNQDEYSNYRVNRRLQEASRNWNRRVPKLQDRIPSSKNE